MNSQPIPFETGNQCQVHYGENAVVPDRIQASSATARHRREDTAYRTSCCFPRFLLTGSDARERAALAFEGRSLFTKAVATYGLLAIVWIMAGGAERPFIYFQF